MPSNKILLFVYGQLEPEYYGIESEDFCQQDMVRGNLYQMPNDDAALKDLNSPTAQLIHGYVLELDEKELPRLDKLEAPEYERKSVITFNGHIAFVYIYLKDLPSGAYKTDCYVK